MAESITVTLRYTSEAVAMSDATAENLRDALSAVRGLHGSIHPDGPTVAVFLEDDEECGDLNMEHAVDAFTDAIAGSDGLLTVSVRA
jgi:hypothetical protein